MWRMDEMGLSGRDYAETHGAAYGGNEDVVVEEERSWEHRAKADVVGEIHLDEEMLINER